MKVLVVSVEGCEFSEENAYRLSFQGKVFTDVAESSSTPDFNKQELRVPFAVVRDGKEVLVVSVQKRIENGEDENGEPAYERVGQGAAPLDNPGKSAKIIDVNIVKDVENSTIEGKIKVSCKLIRVTMRESIRGTNAVMGINIHGRFHQTSSKELELHLLNGAALVGTGKLPSTKQESFLEVSNEISKNILTLQIKDGDSFETVHVRSKGPMVSAYSCGDGLHALSIQHSKNIVTKPRKALVVDARMSIVPSGLVVLYLDDVDSNHTPDDAQAGILIAPTDPDVEILERGPTSGIFVFPHESHTPRETKSKEFGVFGLGAFQENSQIEVFATLLRIPDSEPEESKRKPEILGHVVMKEKKRHDGSGGSVNYLLQGNVQVDGSDCQLEVAISIMNDPTHGKDAEDKIRREELARKARENEARRIEEEEEEEEEEERKAREEEKRKLEEEEEAIRKLKEDEARKRQEEEAEKARIEAEEEARKREEEARKREEEEARKREEEEARKREEEEAIRKEEEYRLNNERAMAEREDLESRFHEEIARVNHKLEEVTKEKEKLEKEEADKVPSESKMEEVPTTNKGKLLNKFRKAADSVISNQSVGGMIAQTMGQELKDKQKTLVELMNDNRKLTEALQISGKDQVELREYINKLRKNLYDEKQKYKKCVDENKDAMMYVTDLAGVDIPSELSMVDRDVLLQVATVAGIRIQNIERDNLELKAMAGDAKAVRIQLGDLQEAYKDLQDAHVQQANYIQKLQKSVSQVDAYRNTIEMQERVITKMQTIVEQKLHIAKLEGGPNGQAAGLMNAFEAEGAIGKWLADLDDPEEENEQIEMLEEKLKNAKEELEILRKKLFEVEEAANDDIVKTKAQAEKDVKEAKDETDKIKATLEAKEMEAAAVYEELSKQAHEASFEVTRLRTRLFEMEIGAAINAEKDLDTEFDETTGFHIAHGIEGHDETSAGVFGRDPNAMRTAPVGIPGLGALSPLKNAESRNGSALGSPGGFGMLSDGSTSPGDGKVPPLDFSSITAQAAGGGANAANAILEKTPRMSKKIMGAARRASVMMNVLGGQGQGGPGIENIALAMAASELADGDEKKKKKKDKKRRKSIKKDKSSVDDSSPRSSKKKMKKKKNKSFNDNDNDNDSDSDSVASTPMNSPRGGGTDTPGAMPSVREEDED